MAGEPEHGQSDDRRMAEALRAGDVIALTEVYDAYAPFLFDYCHALLRDRVEAAGALRACLVSAREHAERLGDPRRLRGWLYALARKECMRRRDSPTRHTGQEAPEAPDDLTPDQLARREERRVLAHSALAALGGRQREAIDLEVRHELDEADLAGVFGTDAAEIHRLLEQTREDLAAALHAVLVAQAHQAAQHHAENCPDLPVPTGSWPLTPPAATALVRHVADCPACGARETPPLPADRLLSVLPIAAIPADLRLDVLTAATAPERAANRRTVAAWAEPFDEHGWPLPYEPGAARARSPRRRGALLAVAGAGAAAAVLLAGAMSAFGGGSEAPAAAGGTAPAASGTGLPSGPGGETPPDGADPSPTASSPSPSRSTSPSPSPSKSATPSRSPSRTPSPSPSSKPPQRPGPPAPPQPGHLTVQGCDMDVRRSCEVRISAVGGPVDWRVTGTSGELSAGGAGRLRAGQAIRVQVRRTNGWCLGGEEGAVSFSPAGSASVHYC